MCPMKPINVARGLEMSMGFNGDGFSNSSERAKPFLEYGTGLCRSLFLMVSEAITGFSAASIADGMIVTVSKVNSAIAAVRAFIVAVGTFAVFVPVGERRFKLFF